MQCGFPYSHAANILLGISPIYFRWHLELFNYSAVCYFPISLRFCAGLTWLGLAWLGDIIMYCGVGTRQTSETCRCCADVQLLFVHRRQFIFKCNLFRIRMGDRAGCPKLLRWKLFLEIWMKNVQYTEKYTSFQFGVVWDFHRIYWIDIHIKW